jgi:hypothetical protein
LFWGKKLSNPDIQPVYEVPKGSDHHAIFTASIAVGGLVRETVRMAGSLYGPYEYWPGPLDEAGSAPADCSDYDEIYEIRRSDIEAYNGSGLVTDNLGGWPWMLGAPVLDGDGQPDNYNLEGGDRPALSGDQMLWWVMNDRGNTHIRFSTLPLGMELRARVFAFAIPAMSATRPFTPTTCGIKEPIPWSRRISACSSTRIWDTAKTTM